jgi:hypothetical protein
VRGSPSGLTPPGGTHDMGYPLYLYGPDQTYRIVADDAERDQAIQDGFLVWTRTTATTAPDPLSVPAKPRSPKRPRPVAQE